MVTAISDSCLMCLTWPAQTGDLNSFVPFGKERQRFTSLTASQQAWCSGAVGMTNAENWPEFFPMPDKIPEYISFLLRLTPLPTHQNPKTLRLAHFLATRILKPKPPRARSPLPLQDVALFHTLLLATKKPAGKAVERPWAPAAHVRAQRVTHMPVSSWEKRNHELQGKRKGRYRWQMTSSWQSLFFKLFQSRHEWP